MQDVTRFVMLTALLLICGAVAFRIAVITRAALPHPVSSRLERSAAQYGLYAALLLVATSLPRLYWQTSAMLFPGDNPWPMLRTVLLGTTWGHVWIVQVTVAIVLALLLQRMRGSQQLQHSASWLMPGIAACVLAFTPAFSGHAFAQGDLRAVLVVADGLHVLGASAWMGSLGIFFLTLRRMPDIAAPDIAAVVRTFSPVALICAGLVIASGVIGALVHVPDIASVLSSRYGRLLFAKVVAVGGILFFGWLNWKRATPRIGSDGAMSLRRFAAGELCFALLALALTSLLIVAEPPPP